MAAIDQVKAHFSRLGTLNLEVPEWAAEDGRPMVIYYTPMTLSEKAKLLRVGEEFGSDNRVAHTLITKAKDAQGNALFTLEDKHTLMHQADYNVAMRVALRMNEAVSVEDAGKK